MAKFKDTAHFFSCPYKKKGCIVLTVNILSPTNLSHIYLSLKAQSHYTRFGRRHHQNLIEVQNHHPTTSKPRILLSLVSNRIRPQTSKVIVYFPPSPCILLTAEWFLRVQRVFFQLLTGSGLGTHDPVFLKSFMEPFLKKINFFNIPLVVVVW